MAGVTEDYIHEDCRRPGVLKPQSADLTVHIKMERCKLRLPSRSDVRVCHLPCHPGQLQWDAALTSLT